MSDADAVAAAEAIAAEAERHDLQFTDGWGVDAFPVAPLELRPPTPGETPSDAARRLDQDGFLYLPGVLEAGEVATLRQQIVETATDPAHPIDSGIGTLGHSQAEGVARLAGEAPPPFETGVMSWWARAGAADPAAHLQYLDRDPVCAVAEAALGPGSRIMQSKAWATGPGRLPGRMHADFLPVRGIPEAALLSGAVTVPTYLITAHYYLEDITEELGPTCFIPQSHKSGRWPEPTERSWRGIGLQSALCRAGDVVMFRSDCWHAATPNTSSSTRHILQVHYASGRIGHPLQPRKAPPTPAVVMGAASSRQRRLLADFPADAAFAQ